MLCSGACRILEAVCILALQVQPAGATGQCGLSGTVVDETNVPVGSARVTLQTPAGLTLTAYTDSAGRFELNGADSGQCRLSVNKPGYYRLSDRPLNLKEGSNEASLTLAHETEILDRVEVTSTPDPTAPEEADHHESLVAREIRDLPAPNSHDLRSVLTALPAVVRDNGGQLHIAGGRAEDNQILLDEFEIGDPVSGTLTARVNVDSVREVEIDSGRYGVQYGGAGAGVLSLSTVSGDDQLRVGMTNFIPVFDIQRGVHLGNWYPRFTFSGPLQKEKAWFSAAASIQRTYKLITELPPGADTTVQWAGDGLLRAQVNLAEHNRLQGSFLFNRQYNSNVGLGPFSPQSTTTDLQAQRSFVAVKDQAWTGRSFFDLGAAVDTGYQNSLPMGSAPYVLQPGAASGNYFQTLRQRARRFQAVGSATLPARNWHGRHDFQVGFRAERTTWAQGSVRSLLQVRRQDGTLYEQTQYVGPAAFRLADTRVGIYTQDSWVVSRLLMFQAGLRADWDAYLDHSVVSPRIAANLAPWRDDRAKLSLAWGVFYQPMRFDKVGPALDQQRQDVYYDATGKTVVRGPVTTRFAIPAAGLKLPYFYTTSLEWTQRIRKGTYAGVNLLSRSGRNGLAYDLGPPIDDAPSFLLQNNRRDTYRALELSLKHTFGDNSGMSANYTRSRARSNEVIEFAPSQLMTASQQAGPVEWDAPNRFISSGWTPARFWDLFLSYSLDYRTGFPFGVVDGQNRLVGAPNRMRYPDFFSLNLGIEKRLKILGRMWALRLAVINSTGNANPDAVVNNIDAPNYLTFAGGQKRAFTARLRLVK